LKTPRLPLVAIGFAAIIALAYACASGDDPESSTRERLVFTLGVGDLDRRQLVYWDINDESKEQIAEGVTDRLPTALAESSAVPIEFHAGAADQDLKIWTTADDKFASIGPGSGGAAGPNGSHAYCVESGRQVLARSGSTDEGVVVHDWQRERGCADMAWSGDGRLAFVDVDPSDATGDPRLALFVFDFEHGTTITPLSGHTGGAGPIGWSADSTSIAVTFGGVSSAILDANSGEVLTTFDAELALFSPRDASMLLTLSRRAGVAELTVVRSGAPVASLELRDPDGGLAWSPMGDAVAIVDLFGVHQWNWEDDDLVTLYAADLPDEILGPSVLWLSERE
jgi:hypothetical protein